MNALRPWAFLAFLVISSPGAAAEWSFIIELVTPCSGGEEKERMGDFKVVDGRFQQTSAASQAP